MIAVPLVLLLGAGSLAVGASVKLAGDGLGDAGDGVKKAGDSLTKLVFVGGSFYVLYKIWGRIK